MPVVDEHDDATTTQPDSWRGGTMSLCRDAPEALRHHDKTPYGRETSAGVLVSAKHQDGLADPWRDGATEQGPAARLAGEDALAAVAGGQAPLFLAVADPNMHPCTNCTRLNVGHYCSKYRRVMPEPYKPNACIHFQQQLPEQPWANTDEGSVRALGRVDPT
jgi:hypothetical protein